MLMAAAGKPLDFWQQQGADLLLSVRADGKWACFEYCEWVARQNGKGALLEARVLLGFLCLGEELIMWSAHEVKTAMEAMRRIKNLLAALGEKIDDNLIEIEGVLIKVSNANGDEGFERLDTGARIKFIARSKGSGRGFSGDVNIIDEAFAYTAVQHAALLPTMNARENPQIIYTSTPPLDGATGEVMFALRARAEAGGDDSLGYRDWGCAGDLDNLDKVDLDDRALWAAANPSLGGRVTEEMIARNRTSMRTNGGREFAREILGIWPVELQAAAGVIDMDHWVTLSDPESKPGYDVAFGVEVEHDRSAAAIVAYSVRADGLGHGEVIDKRPGVAWVTPRMLQLREKWNPVAIGVDAKGPATTLIVEFEVAGIRRPKNPERPKRGDLLVLSLQEMATAVANLLDAIDERTLRHLDDADLNDAAAVAKLRPVGDVFVWGRRMVTGDISPLTGLTVARFALMQRVDKVKRAGRRPLVGRA